MRKNHSIQLDQGYRLHRSCSPDKPFENQKKVKTSTVVVRVLNASDFRTLRFARGRAIHHSIQLDHGYRLNLRSLPAHLWRTNKMVKTSTVGMVLINGSNFMTLRTFARACAIRHYIQLDQSYRFQLSFSPGKLFEIQKKCQKLVPWWWCRRMHQTFRLSEGLPGVV